VQLTLWTKSVKTVLKPLPFALVLVLVYQLVAQKQTHSALLGDVRATVTQVREASAEELTRYKLHPRTGYHAVLVFVTFKNIGNYPSCTELHEWLRVKQEYEYPRAFAWSALKVPNPHNLPATEESSGAFGFEVKDGTQPAVLKLIRNTLGETMCVEMQHREKAISGPQTAILSLQGMSEK
jgi:hypothetical protein